MVNPTRMIDLVTIEGGRFLMGENPDDKFANDTERPRHAVDVPAFRLGRAPVTISEFREFRPYHERGLPGDWPAAMVSWDDAVAYCEWLGDGMRLPSEAEWEFAARAGSQSPFPWGADITPAHANYYYTEQGNKVGPGHRTPAGHYPANAFGIFDLVGNVCEWTLDAWQADHHDAPADGSPRAATTVPVHRVLRGGAWDYLPRLLRVSWRDHLLQNHRRDNVGFRIASNL
ncbi:MAG: formylglycine-generating enzyme family protein [Chthoniobacterales bacterium]